MSWTRISPDRLAALLGELPTGVPAYQALAARVRRLAAEGRLARDTQLPSERALAVALGVSRTTVTRAYDALVETGYAAARQGSGTVVDVPGSALGALGGLLTARSTVDGVIDLTCAAPAAVPDTHAALGWAVDQMPAQVRGSGYYPEGLPALREAIAVRYCERGLPTSADEVVVTTGALAGLAIVIRLLVSPGDRVLTESPSYPNAMEALRSGRIEFSVDQQPYLQGYLPVVFLAERARYGLFPAEGEVIPTGPNFVTRDTAAQVERLSALGIR